MSKITLKLFLIYCASLLLALSCGRNDDDPTNDQKKLPKSDPNAENIIEHSTGVSGYDTARLMLRDSQNTVQ